MALTDFVEHVRLVAQAATVAESRHPNCGAFGYLRSTLAMLPPELQVKVDVRPHPEDDEEDRGAEVRRLVRENVELRRRLAEATGAQLDLFAEVTRV